MIFLYLSVLEGKKSMFRNFISRYGRTIVECWIRRQIIRGLKQEYVPFVTSVQGWANYPSLVALENILASQEPLARKMACCSMSSSCDDGSVLFIRNKKFERKKNYQPHDVNTKGDDIKALLMNQNSKNNPDILIRLALIPCWYFLQ